MGRRIALAFVLALAFAGQAVAGEMEDRELLKHKVGQLYRDELFADLDRLFDEAGDQSTRTESGVWTLWVLHRGLVEAESRPANDTQAQAQAQRVHRWLVQRPGSVTAPLAVAEVELRHARALGCGQCTVVAENERMDLYQAALLEANRLLVEAKAKSAADPQWYADMLELGRLLHWPPFAVDKFLAEASEHQPGYYTIWFNAVDLLLEQPDTAGANIEALARRAMLATRARDGASVYARIWWYAAQVRYGSHLFTATPIVWKDFDAATADLMARYPDDWNRNNLANFACNAKHPERARVLMAGHEPMPEAWDSYEVYEECIRPGSTPLQT